ncbi:SurA N-terminal domain-containing protein [Sulfuricurvum sp.]|uniref:SurA N-terminal domain-containing protein n=1 Tax=Sulfuricurvum sp. TaxID=2025608 RepID=UPI0026355BE6|nr:SurA N-terminal domain-containing protein [Sulfuricurvum sp.]MDD3596561.1 SurA N-terminal domain-containing protein [Sulfuricurvum sp.]
MKFSLALASLVVASSCVFAAPATLATVNGKAITTNDAAAFMSKAIPGMSFDKLDPKMKRQVVDQLINQYLIKEQVKKSGLQNTAAFKAQYAAIKDDLAVDMWMKQQMSKITVTEKEAKAFYDANGDKMKQGDKKLTFDQVQKEITQFLKVEKFKAQMTKTTDSLRGAAKVEVKL